MGTGQIAMKFKFSLRRLFLVTAFICVGVWLYAVTFGEYKARYDSQNGYQIYTYRSGWVSLQGRLDHVTDELGHQSRPYTIEDITSNSGMWILYESSILAVTPTGDGNYAVYHKHGCCYPSWEVWTPELLEYCSGKVDSPEMWAVTADFLFGHYVYSKERN